MPHVKKLSTGTENYPKARAQRLTNRRPSLQKTRVSTPSRSSGPSLDIGRNYPTTDRVELNYSNGLDSDLENMKKLSRGNLNGHSSGGSTSGGTKTSGGTTKRVKVRKGRNAGGATKPSAGNPSSKGSSNTGAIKTPPKRPANTGPGRSTSSPVNHSKNEHALAILRGKRNKQLAYEQSLKEPPAKPVVKKTTKTTSPSKTQTKSKVGGGFKVAGGVLDMYQGVEKMVNGDAEGIFQTGQGIANTVEGVHAVKTGECVTDMTKKGLGKTLQRAGMIANIGMAGLDVKQSYDAYQNGNEVQAAEEAGSAIINTASAFPPTAVIGMIGGLADWAMEASGGDDAMVHALTAGSRAKYANQAHQERSLALDLIHTKSHRIRNFSPAKKREMARGLVGMREYYKKLVAEKNPNAGFIYEHIARVKADLTGRN